jgi:hypothetical protein
MTDERIARLRELDKLELTPLVERQIYESIESKETRLELTEKLIDIFLNYISSHYSDLLQSEAVLKKATELQAENAELRATRESMEIKNFHLLLKLKTAEGAITHALDAVKAYPEHPMTASQIILRQALAEIRK